MRSGSQGNWDFSYLSRKEHGFRLDGWMDDWKGGMVNERAGNAHLASAAVDREGLPGYGKH